MIVQSEQLTPRQRECLTVLRDRIGAGLATGDRDMAAAWGVSINAARSMLRRLEKAKAIKRGKGAAGGGRPVKLAKGTA